MPTFAALLMKGFLFFSYACSTKAMVHRDVAQLVAHYVRDVGVACSSHVIPTFSLLHPNISLMPCMGIRRG